MNSNFFQKYKKIKTVISNGMRFLITLLFICLIIWAYISSKTNKLSLELEKNVQKAPFIVGFKNVNATCIEFFDKVNKIKYIVEKKGNGSFGFSASVDLINNELSFYEPRWIGRFKILKIEKWENKENN